MVSKRSSNTRVIAYKMKLKSQLLTTRFNNSTWKENEDYRKQNPKIGCIYSTPEPNGQHLPFDSVCIILEMNNDTNRIMGIGMVRNKPIYNKYNVYSDPKYNGFAYLGKHRIDRADMTEEEERIMKVFDILCFKGSRHMKRLKGIKSFPLDMLYRCSSILDLVEFSANMFKTRANKMILANESE